MSTNEQTPLSQPTSVVRNTLGKEQVPQDSGRPIFDEALREYYDRNYYHILPVIAEKVHQEKVQQEKLKAVKAHLNFEETSQHSESGTPIRRRDLKERLGPRRIRSRSGSPEPRRSRSESPRKKGLERKAMFKRLEKGVFHRLEDSDDSRHRPHHSRLKAATKVLDQEQRNPLFRNIITKGHPQGERRSCQIVKVCEETYPFTHRIRYFNFPKTQMPSHIKTYDGSEDPEDHLKIFQKAFLENYLQQKKCIKDPIEIHNIMQRDGESMEEFMREVILVMETTRSRAKAKLQEGGFRNQQRPERKQDMFTLLTKTPKEILALDKGKFKPPPPMTTLVEKKMLANSASFMGKKVVAPNKGVQTEQWKRTTQSGKERGNLRERQSISHPNDEDEGTEGPMIIEAEIGGHCIHRMYVDGGSASEILYEHYFNRLRLKIKNQLVPVTTHLIGFSGEIIWPIGKIQLLVRIRDEEHSALAWMNFVVVRSPSPYNGIIGRPGVRKLQAVPSIAHEMLKLPKPADMTGVPRHIAEHRLNVREGCSLVRQKKRGQAADRNQAIQEEVGKLVEAGIMKEVHYHDWLSNLVMVKKHDDSWRMCLDFKDLNKACPKDGYPLPEID
ncbi:reverse transcriptase domain-containing protein [Tanacetum coccineum]